VAKGTVRASDGGAGVRRRSGLGEPRRLDELINRLSCAQDLPTVMALVRRASRRLVGADGATLVLRDGAEVYYADEDAIGPLWKGRRFPIGECVSGLSMLSRRPVAIADIYRDPRVPHDAYRPTFVKSLAIVPVRIAAPIGAIGAYWARRHRPTAAEVALLQTIANCASLALINVRLLFDLSVAREVADRDAAALASDFWKAEQEMKALRQAQEVLERSLQATEERESALRGFSAQLLAVQERERQRIARELHDDVNQRLASLALALDALASVADLPPSVGERTRAMRQQIAQLSEDVHRIAYALHSPVLDHVGLEAAVRDHLDDFRRRTGLRVACAVQGWPEVRGDAARGLFRVIQEALQNVAKHAQARRVAVRLTGSRQKVRVVVEDDGVGFDPDAARLKGRGLGLASMHERVRALRGTLMVRSAPKRGTRVEVRIPAPPPQARDGAPGSIPVSSLP
jgi:signal transduction histidine kinase